jgi:predicted nucleic acid-binding Zn ribbon protein
LTNKKKISKKPINRRSSTPIEVGTILEQTLSSYRIEKKLEEYSAFPQWQEIVGSETAEVAKVVKVVRGKVLVVHVLDAAWAQELSMQKESLLEKVNQVEQGAIIEDIHFITGDPTSIRKNNE